MTQAITEYAPVASNSGAFLGYKTIDSLENSALNQLCLLASLIPGRRYFLQMS